MGMFANALSGQSRQSKRPARQYLPIAFGVMIALSILLWVASSTTRVVGEVMFAGVCLGGMGVYVLGKSQRRADTSVIQKYGLK